MKRRKLTREEAELLTEAAMQRADKQEKSRALPQQAYRDPADFVKFEREKGRKK
jgi:hypothetical protein